MGKRRFTDSQAIEIHTRVKNRESRKSIAREYGVDDSVIEDMVNAKSYRHLGLESLMGIHPPPSEPKSFEQHMKERVVKRDSGCWEWMGLRRDDGYGVFKRSGKPGFIRAHRASYEHHKGPIPHGAQVLHSCDNPCCVNPDHLRVGTHDDNMREMMEKERQAKGSGIAQSRLREDQIPEIFRLRKCGALTIKQIGIVFGVCGATIADVLRGKSWRHVSGVGCNEARI